MGGATATFGESFRGRHWRHLGLPLVVSVALPIGFGVVRGYAAGFNDPVAGGMTQTVKTLIWAAIGLTVFFVAASFDYHWLRTLAGPIYVVVLVLLTLTMLVGTNLFGA